MERDQITPDDKPDLRDIEPDDLGRVSAVEVPEPDGNVVTGESDDTGDGGTGD